MYKQQKYRVIESSRIENENITSLIICTNLIRSCMMLLWLLLNLAEILYMFKIMLLKQFKNIEDYEKKYVPHMYTLFRVLVAHWVF
jgi:hypothetical protein